MKILGIHDAEHPSVVLLKDGVALVALQAVSLNTSFNLRDVPMVSSVADAAEVVRKSGLKYLAVPGFLIRKPSVVAG
jgi:predicted NodU family carbamoyl transferase